MDVIEIEKKEVLKREDAAARLRAVADMLAGESDIGFEQGGVSIKFHVPDEVHLKIELTW